MELRRSKNSSNNNRARAGQTKVKPNRAEHAQNLELEALLKKPNKKAPKPTPLYFSDEGNIAKLSKEDIKSIKEASKTKAHLDSNIHKDHRMRLKSQFLENGINSLTEVQILELLLFYSIPQKDTNPLAHKLLNQFSSIKGVLSAPIEELMGVVGIKQNSAALLKLVNGLLTIPACQRAQR